MTDDCIKKCRVIDVEKDACACGREHEHEPLKNVDDLKDALSALGYKVSKEGEGEIRISE